MPNRQAESPSRQTKTSSLNEALLYVFAGPHAQGNPASVTLVEKLPNLDTHLKKTNLSKVDPVLTYVYISPSEKNTFSICWFNGTSSIQRCGHGTIAAAAFINHIATNKNAEQQYNFISAHETLSVQVNPPHYSLTLPITAIETINHMTVLSQELKHSHRIAKTKKADGYIIVELQDEGLVSQFKLNSTITKLIEKRALIITAKSRLTKNDIVFRYFAPQYGQPEDIATGSAASVLWPFWAQDNILPENQPLRCLQLSKQRGEMEVKKIDKKNIAVSGLVTVSLDSAH